MRRMGIAVLFYVLLLAGICGADSIRQPNDSSEGVAPIEERHSYVAYPPSQVDASQEMGAKRVADQNGTMSESDKFLDNLSLHMKEMAAQESQRDYENSADPFKVYQSQAEEWTKKRAKTREKELEQERRKEFEKELEQDRNDELDRIRAESEAASKQTPKLYSLPSARTDTGEKAGELSSIEEGLYKAYAEQEGVSVEQAKKWVREGKIKISDVTLRDWAWLFETP